MILSQSERFLWRVQPMQTFSKFKQKTLKSLITHGNHSKFCILYILSRLLELLAYSFSEHYLSIFISVSTSYFPLLKFATHLHFSGLFFTTYLINLFKEPCFLFIRFLLLFLLFFIWLISSLSYCFFHFCSDFNPCTLTVITIISGLISAILVYILFYNNFTLFFLFYYFLLTKSNILLLF